MKHKQFTIYLDPDTHKKLKTLAFLKDKTLKTLYTELVVGYVNKHSELLDKLNFKG